MPAGTPLSRPSARLGTGYRRCRDHCRETRSRTERDRPTPGRLRILRDDYGAVPLIADSHFTWASALGAGVALFLGWGLLNILIGVVAPFAIASDMLPGGILVLSPRADAAVFGGDPSELVRATPALRELQRVMFYWLAGVLVGFGFLVLAVTWFGLRRGEPWALSVLAVCWLVTLVAFGGLFKRYADLGASLSLADLPPLFHYPAFVVTPALALSWFGLR